MSTRKSNGVVMANAINAMADNCDVTGNQCENADLARHHHEVAAALRSIAEHGDLTEKLADQFIAMGGVETVEDPWLVLAHASDAFFNHPEVEQAYHDTGRDDDRAAVLTTVALKLLARNELPAIMSAAKYAEDFLRRV